MEYIKLENISTEFCLKNVNLSIKKGEFVVILGHSGAGKSTLLNILAGFIKHEGNIYLDGELINHIPTQKRDLGYLHQEIYLFPNLNIYENIAFALKVKKVNKHSIDKEVQKIAEMTQISHLLDRYPKNLSGGEKQRTGIARSIIAKPKLLLLDEPLSSLDEATASSIREELKMLCSELKLTCIYVTHNKLDAKLLADKVVYINSGEIFKVTNRFENFRDL